MKRLVPLLLLVLAAPCAKAAIDPADIAPDGFARGVAFTVAGYAADRDRATLTNFPVLVRVSPDTIPGFAYSDCLLGDGADVRFLDAAGNLLPSEIDEWNANGESLVWVALPLMTNGTEFAMVYGSDNPGAASTDDVWERYVAVVHGGSSITNSVAGGRAATAGSTDVAAAADAGKVGGGIRKSSAKSIGVNVANVASALASSGRYSVSAWFRRDGNGGAGNGTHVLGASRAAWQNGTGYLWLQEQGNYISIAANGSHQWDSGAYKLEDRAWAHLAFTYEKGVSLKSYFNGAQDQTKSSPGNLENTSGVWTFGSYQNVASDDSFKGDMDELRIFDGVASADWIKAECDTMSGASFLAAGPAVSLQTTPEPWVSLSAPASAVLYTNATLTAIVGSLGMDATASTDAGWVDLLLVVSANADLSSPLLSETLGRATAAPATMARTLVPLATNATYYAKLLATNEFGVAGESGLVSFTTRVPGAPSGTAAFLSSGLTRIAAAGTVTDFGAGAESATIRLEASTDGFATLVSSAETDAVLGQSAAFAIDGLDQNTSYALRFRLVNDWGLVAYVPLPETYMTRPSLVGLYTFDGANPLDAVIGSPAKEGVCSGNNAAAALSDTMTTLTMVADADVLGDRTGVVSVPTKSTLAIPNPGLQKNWTITFWFYAPSSAGWRCFFQFNGGNNADGSLFIKNNGQIGASTYDNISGLLGAWHQLTVSSDNNTQTIWYDQQRLGNTRGWNIAGLSLLQFSLDNDGEDATMYFDEIRLYDTAAPEEVFPNGVSAGPVLLDRWTENTYTDDFATFSRTPDRIIEDAPYRTYVFSRHGTFTFTPVRRRVGCSALLVGGGGAGGLQRGGGGGGGGVVSASDLPFLPQPYEATVGAGGAPAVHTYWYSNRSDAGRLYEGVTPDTACGGDTMLSIGSSVLHVAHGGGGGGNFNYAGSNKPGESYGLAGASGGGSSGKSTVRAAGIDGEGHAGGAATTDGDNSAGGGGGAGSAGADGVGSKPGAGGAGVESSITGTAVVYGGGGGAGGGYSGAAVGAGGAGGGGTGVSSTSGRARTTASNGTDGLGGGGGGGSGLDNNPFNSMGGRGGDGAIVLRIQMTDVPDPEPSVFVYTTEVGYTNAMLGVRLLTLGDGAVSAGATFRLSMNADMSDPLFETNFPGPVATVPVSFSVACAPLLANATYYAQATATNNLGVGGASAILSFQTLDPRPVFSATVNSDHISPDVSLSFTHPGWGNAITRITVQVSATGDFTRPEMTKVFTVNLSAMPTNLEHIALTGLAAASPTYFRFTAENSRGYRATIDQAVDLAFGGDNVWSGLSDNVDDSGAYVFKGGLPTPGNTLYFTSPAGLSPVIDRDIVMPSLRFTSGTNNSIDTSYWSGYHSCGYDWSGTGLLTFTAEKPILQASKGTNVVRNPIQFYRSNGQTVYVVSNNGRLDLAGRLSLPSGTTNTTMRVNGEGGEVHFGGPSPDFMGRLFLESSFTLSLDSPFAMTNVNNIYFEGGWGSTTYLRNGTGAPMTFPRCEQVKTTTGWSSTRSCFSGAPFIFPVGTLVWSPRAFDSSAIDADLVIRDVQVTKGDNADAYLDKLGNGTLAVTGTMRWDANGCKHYVRLSGGCLWPQKASGLPPNGEIYNTRDSAWQGTLGLSGDYAPMLDGSSTPRVFQSSKWASWGFTGFGGDRTVCWNADPTFNLTNTAGGTVEIRLTDSQSVNEAGKAYSEYYAYPPYLVFGNRSEFADGTVLFMNPIRYELGQSWDAKTYFESTNHVVAARLRGSLKLGSSGKTWNFSGHKFGGYLALEADNSDFTGKVNVHEKGNLLVNSNLVAQSVTVQSGAGLGGTGSLSTAGGTTVQSGGALFGGEWNKGGCLTLGGKVTLESGSAVRAEVGPSNDRVGFAKLAPGSTLKLVAPVYVDVDTDPRVSPIRGAPRKILDWSEASFDSGSAPTRADFVARPESNSDIRSIYLFVRDDALWVNYLSVRYPPSTIMILR